MQKVYFFLLKILNIVKQYEDFLKYLKENGALLNSIRPYYLLSY